MSSYETILKIRYDFIYICFAYHISEPDLTGNRRFWIAVIVTE